MPAQNRPLGDELAEKRDESEQPGQLHLGAPAPVNPAAHAPAAFPPLPALPQQYLAAEDALSPGRKYVAYTVKLPSEQLAALQSIWLELKRLYGTHSPDKSGMIQQAITEWLRRWDGPERNQLLQDLLEIRQDTRRRQYRK